jgi:hypothetical protein
MTCGQVNLSTIREHKRMDAGYYLGSTNAAGDDAAAAVEEAEIALRRAAARLKCACEMYAEACARRRRMLAEGVVLPLAE